MDKKQKLEKTVKDLQKALDKAQADLAEAEVTYSIGDRFKNGRGEKNLLCHVGHLKVCMVHLDDGEWHNNPVEVSFTMRITEQELSQICCCNLARYWDNRKKVNV